MSAPDAPPLPRTAPGAPVFAEAWQARAFALAMALNARGRLAWPDFAAALGAELAARRRRLLAGLAAGAGGLAGGGGAGGARGGGGDGRALAAGGGVGRRMAARSGWSLERPRAQALRSARHADGLFAAARRPRRQRRAECPGEVVPAFELPRRAEIIRARVEEVGLGPVLAPDRARPRDARRACMRRTTSTSCRGPCRCGRRRGAAGRAMPFVWPVPGLRADVPPDDIDGLLGFYSMDAGATFVEGTWAAVKASHDVALTAAGLVQGGARAAFALCRPPGHHAMGRFAGRLLLRQQRGSGRRVAARRRGGAGQRARRRLSPRQRHAGDLRCARRTCRW